MTISDMDIKKLWGKSAGRCAYPGCNIDCVPHLDGSNPTVVGEMAHIIARQEGGPRGQRGGGANTYDNLILLCPTHHTMVDKAPEGTYPARLLLQWKHDHEASVARAHQGAVKPNRDAWFDAVNRLLIENHSIWKTYGPESEEAARNPMSSAAEIWVLRKLGKVVPNNRTIINLIDANKGLLTPEEY